MILHGGVDRKTGEERTDDARKVDQIRKHARDRYHPEQRDKEGLLALSHVTQHIRVGT